MNDSKPEQKTWSRKMTTKRSVVVADIASRVVITAGGIGTILAVLGVCIFLIAVAAPLFKKAEVDEGVLNAVVWDGAKPLGMGIDEYQVLGWSALSDGSIRAFGVNDGAELARRDLFEGKTLTAFSTAKGSDKVVFGFSDGSIATGTLGFSPSFLSADEVPPEIRAELESRPRGYAVPMGEDMVQLTPERQYRVQRLVSTVDATKRIAESPVRAVRHVLTVSGQMLAAITGADGDIAVCALAGREKRSFMTGTVSFKFGPVVELPYRRAGAGDPDFLALSSEGKDVYVAWADGGMYRIRTSDLTAPFIAEEAQLLPDGGALTTFDFVLGDATLMWGTQEGQLSGGFLIRRADLDPAKQLPGVQRADAATYGFALAKNFTPTGAAVTAMATSMRSRLMVSGYADGSIRVHNVTSQDEILAFSLPASKPVLKARIALKEDGILVYTEDGIYRYTFDPKYPEASMSALFRPVWYEGYPGPQHFWQSSSATQESEPQLGLMPLIFGTIKATIYSMIFGAPIAFLAAIFSSEFLDPKLKAGIKPTVELMASLPSVVLGFLAALVFAPMVETVVPAALVGFVTVPVMLLATAYIWQLFPMRVTLPLARYRIFISAIPVALGILLAYKAGPAMEAAFFAGDLKAWLSWDPVRADPTQEIFRPALGGWLFVTGPLAVVVAVFGVNGILAPYMRGLARRLDALQIALADAARAIALALITCALAWGAAAALANAGHDPRTEGGWILLCVPLAGLATVYIEKLVLGSVFTGLLRRVDRRFTGLVDLAKFTSMLLIAWGLAALIAQALAGAGLGVNSGLLGTFVQRNSLVVGIIMGFAIIPIIYTIADDALSTVPDHLRGASLGAGATKWQTAVRVVIPTAMSGLFSALMIGLGRAVGETMIVLMAAGNTPILKWNVFEGFRTLSANIAVELPEAVKGSTHYRTLFMAALVLFAMTFVLNTIAEIVRVRFRKRATSL